MWKAFETPLKSGQSSGIFSVAFRDAKHGVVVGGDYQKEKEAVDNLAITSDGGETWTLVRGPQARVVVWGGCHLLRRALSLRYNPVTLNWVLEKMKYKHLLIVAASAVTLIAAQTAATASGRLKLVDRASVKSTASASERKRLALAFRQKDEPDHPQTASELRRK